MLLPASDGSSGICTFRRGREGPPTRKLFAREGGVCVCSGIDETDNWRRCEGGPVSDRLGCGGEAVLREPADASNDGGRLCSFLICESAKAAKCCERTDRFSSMGVKMLCCLRCGSFLIADTASIGGACGAGLSPCSLLGSAGAGIASWSACSCDRCGCGEGRRTGALGSP